MKKAHWSIDFKQVDNGYLLKVRDNNSYKETESVYASFELAVAAFRKATGHIEDHCLKLSPGQPPLPECEDTDDNTIPF